MWISSKSKNCYPPLKRTGTSDIRHDYVFFSPLPTDMPFLMDWIRLKTLLHISESGCYKNRYSFLKRTHHNRMKTSLNHFGNYNSFFFVSLVFLLRLCIDPIFLEGRSETFCLDRIAFFFFFLLLFNFINTSASTERGFGPELTIFPAGTSLFLLKTDNITSFIWRGEQLY